MPDFESYPCEISTTSREDFTFVGIYFGEWRPVIKFRFPRISSYIRILCYPLYMCICVCVCVCKTGLSHFFFFLYCLDVIRQVSWLWAWERKRGKIIPPLLRFFFFAILLHWHTCCEKRKKDENEILIEQISGRMMIANYLADCLSLKFFSLIRIFLQQSQSGPISSNFNTLCKRMDIFKKIFFALRILLENLSFLWCNSIYLP